MLGWDQAAPTLARRTGDSTRTKGSLVTPHHPQFTLKGCFHSRPKSPSAPAPARLQGARGWQGRAGRHRGELGVLAMLVNADPLPVLPQLGSQPCHHLSPEVQGRWSSRGRGSLGWRVQLQEGARGRGSSQTPCRYCPLNELQGTGLGSSQAQGLEGLVLSQVFTEE